MIDFGRVANNMIFLAVISAFFYIIYIKMKKQNSLTKFKNMFSRGRI